MIDDVANFGYVYEIHAWAVSKDGKRLAKSPLLSGDYYDSLSISVNISKSITSMNDTATVTVMNHPVIEEINQDIGLLHTILNINIEVDIAIHTLTGGNKGAGRCVFTGDLVDIYPKEDISVTDQALVMSLVAGHRATHENISNVRYAKGTSYRTIVEDLMNSMVGYKLTVIADRYNKLDKELLSSRTFHGKTITLLNDIAKDMEMTYGFDSANWKTSTIDGDKYALKHCYWVDKNAYFDVMLLGNFPRFANYKTSKHGRTGFTLNKITFKHATDALLNIGLPMLVSDEGTLDISQALAGRIDRMTINNNVTSIEMTLLVDATLAVVGTNSGLKSGNNGSFTIN